MLNPRWDCGGIRPPHVRSFQRDKRQTDARIVREDEDCFARVNVAQGNLTFVERSRDEINRRILGVSRIAARHSRARAPCFAATYRWLFTRRHENCGGNDGAGRDHRCRGRVMSRKSQEIYAPVTIEIHFHNYLTTARISGAENARPDSSPRHSISCEPLQIAANRALLAISTSIADSPTIVRSSDSDSRVRQRRPIVRRLL